MHADLGTVLRHGDARLNVLLDSLNSSGRKANVNLASESDIKTMANLSGLLKEALSRLITANHILDHHNLTDGFGHISLRNPDIPSTFYMTGQPATAFVTNESDLAHYQIEDGSPVVPGDPGSTTHPYSARFCHSGIMKRYPGVKAVVHSHSPAVTTVGVTGVGLKPVYHMAGFLGDRVPVFDIGDVYDEEPSLMQRNMLVNSVELGDRLASCLSAPTNNQTAVPEYTVVLQRGHGFCTWGESVEEAVFRAVYTQQNAEIQMAATDFSVVASGELNIKPLSREEVKDCTLVNKESTRKAWMYWSRLVESNPLYRNELMRSQVRAAPGSYRKTQSNRMAPF